MYIYYIYGISVRNMTKQKTPNLQLVEGLIRRDVLFKADNVMNCNLQECNLLLHSGSPTVSPVNFTGLKSDL